MIASAETSQKEQIRKLPSLPGQPVVGLAGDVAEHEAVLGEVVRDRQHALAEHLVIARQEAEDGGQQGRGVERVGVVVLAQDTALDAVVEDVLADLLGDGPPFGLELRVPSDLRRASRRGPSRPSTSASTRRSAGACRAPPRSPGPASSRPSSRTPPGPAPPARARGAAAGSGGCGAGSSRGRRRRRRSGAGRRRHFPPARATLPRIPRDHPESSRSRSRRPSIPYMICSPPSSFGSSSPMNCMNSLASQSRFRK